MPKAFLRKKPKKATLLAALLSAAILGQVAGIVLLSWPLLTAASAAALISDVLFRFSVAKMPHAVSVLRTGLLLIGFALIAPHVFNWNMLLLVSAASTLHLGSVLIPIVQASTIRRAKRLIAWRNLTVGESAKPPAVQQSSATYISKNRALAVELVLIVGVAASIAADSETGTVLSSLTLIAIFAGILIWLIIEWESYPDGEQVDEYNAKIAQALASYEPTVAVYFSGPANSSYALAVWRETLIQNPHPTVIVVREPVHLDVLADTGLPIVCLPEADSVETVLPDSVRVMLYPTNVLRNNHGVRLRGILHCFIGHGDSDKAGSMSPVSRMYNEIWVAGMAGKRRYEFSGEGFDLDRIRLVGRPQLKSVSPVTRPPRRGAPLTVLYAPTWEGFFDASNYSSLARDGVAIVETLISLGHTVLFKPHPASGLRDRRAKRAISAISMLIEGTAGERVPDLLEAFNRSDVLISDVSSVVSDYLASRKPYVITNHLGNETAAFITEFPVAQGGYVLAPGAGDLEELIEEIVDTDPKAQARRILAEDTLGSTDEDPMARFLSELGAAIERSDAARAESARRIEVAGL